MREVSDGVVVAVADGHGSRTHVRSDAGSRLAVEAACALGAELIEGGLLRLSDDLIVDRLRVDAAVDLVGRWREAVLADVAANPWSADDLAVSPGVDRDPFHGYGSTILVALAGETRLAILQLGDGDVLVGRRSGAVTLPVPGDDRLIGNQTTSLCLTSAADDFRAATLPIGDDPIRMVSVTTDGYANSFASESWGDDVGADLLSHLDREGLDFIAENLADWLGDSAEIGGDDVTMGFLAAVVEEVEIPDQLDDNGRPHDGPSRDLADLDEVTTQLQGRHGRRRLLLIVTILVLIVFGVAGVITALIIA